MHVLLKILIYLLIVPVVVFILIFLSTSIFEKAFLYSGAVKYGVTFTPNYATYLKLDWQKTYLQILDELKVKNLRLPSYWDVLQPEMDKYDFSETDFMLNEAVKREARVILVVGQRQPRWPECHIPKWARSITTEQRQQKTLEFVQNVVERYKNNRSVRAYQVENEPFVNWFGECEIADKDFLLKEVQLVKNLDKKKPIIITDSGEWGSWIDSISSSDILGVSVYRTAYNPNLGIYTNYPFTPAMYNLKASIIKRLTQDKRIIISELQTEPWLSGSDSSQNSPLKQNQLFSLESFKDHINFAQKTGFDEAYLWGVEWWYFMEKNGYPEYLDFAKTLF